MNGTSKLNPVVRSLYKELIRSSNKYSGYVDGAATHNEIGKLFPTLNSVKLSQIKDSTLKRVSTNKKLILNNTDLSSQLFQLNSNLTLNALDVTHTLSKNWVLSIIRETFHFPLTISNINLSDRISLGFHAFKCINNRLKQIKQFKQSNYYNTLNTYVINTTPYTKITIESKLFRIYRPSTDNTEVYTFNYYITITNTSKDKIIHLQRRKWTITDENNNVQQVEGEGVIGKKPVLGPGDSHHYSSTAVINSLLGKQEGAFYFDIYTIDPNMDWKEHKKNAEIVLNMLYNKETLVNPSTIFSTYFGNAVKKDQFEAPLGPFLLDGSQNPESMEYLSNPR